MRDGWLSEGPSAGRSLDQSLLCQPFEQAAFDLLIGLPHDLGHDRPPSAWAHQVPHRRRRRLTPALVGWMAIIGHKMEIATAIVNATLLDFVCAHQGAHWTRGGARDGRWVHARRATTGCGEARMPVM